VIVLLVIMRFGREIGLTRFLAFAGAIDVQGIVGLLVRIAHRGKSPFRMNERRARPVPA
jgi:hypothetical protein